MIWAIVFTVAINVAVWYDCARRRRMRDEFRRDMQRACDWERRRVST